MGYFEPYKGKQSSFLRVSGAMVSLSSSLERWAPGSPSPMQSRVFGLRALGARALRFVGRVEFQVTLNPKGPSSPYLWFLGPKVLE